MGLTFSTSTIYGHIHYSRQAKGRVLSCTKQRDDQGDVRIGQCALAGADGRIEERIGDHLYELDRITYGGWESKACTCPEGKNHFSTNWTLEDDPHSQGGFFGNFIKGFCYGTTIVCVSAASILIALKYRKQSQ